ncbi:rhomboid family intramembrane serine protease [Burkholderia ubonensis]|uniref:Rhomboid family intramembrane serine protease n=1 Tax=Burkholderia ubonensis TaxID=101571 RepID=A0AAW3MTR4_9BURK|nr:rhomboid family intramembrane serine protease [Burkholderia ubonensis]KVP98002.1 rhomboid family intramembrane serine protease [Burkholderia ubonensis]KVZ92699.1 rhomboid family intramembrane serine protease [Burkholderia ubonensis]
MQIILTGLRSRATSLALFVGSIWAVSCLGFVFPLKHALGLEPLSLFGLTGIISAPWVHAGFGHLMANTVPLLLLGWLAMFPKQEDFWRAIIGGALGAGTVAWLLGGPNTVHIGASGLAFGLFGFILARGFYARRPVDVIVALFAAGTYGFSMLWGLLPVYPGVSWQSHVGGAVGGVLTARMMRRSY